MLGGLAPALHRTQGIYSDGMKQNDGEFASIIQFHAAGYYLAGRFAAMAAFVPTAPILWHHAIEMLLKAEVIKSRTDLTVDQLRKHLKRDFGHNLHKLWAAVGQLYASTDLKPFDSTIGRLHAFEEVRYPENDVTTIIELTFETIDGPIYVHGDRDKGKTLACRISLEEIDSLMATLWGVFHVEPSLLKGPASGYGSFVQTMYQLHNRRPMYPQDIDMYFRKRR